MIHSYQLIETDASDDWTPWKGTRLLGEINAAKSWLGRCRAEADFTGDLDYRSAEEGDDPIDTYSDNALIDIRRNASVEAVLRAEGILACAQRRYDRLIEDEAKKAAKSAGWDVPRGSDGCTCGTPPFAPPEPAADCPHHG